VNRVDVTRFGADCTGGNDAAPAFARAYERAAYLGADVYAPEGIYVFSGSNRFELSAPHVGFFGDGIGKTVLKLAPSISDADMMAAPTLILVKGWLNSGGYATNVVLRHFSIDGSGDTQDYSAPATAAINAFQVQRGGVCDVEVFNWYAPVTPGQESALIHLVDSPQSAIRRCITRSSPESQGARLSGQQLGSCYGGRIVDHFSDGCMSAAVMWQVIGGSILSCEARRSRYNGIDVEDCRGGYVGGGSIVSESTLAGIRFAESQNCTGQGIVSFNNAGAGILLSGKASDGGGSVGVILTANQCFDDQATPTQSWGVEEIEAADWNVIHGNRLVRNVMGPKSLSGPNTLAEGNVEF